MTAKEFYYSVKENKTLEEIMIEFARIKCLEAIKNTRYKAVDIIQENTYQPDITSSVKRFEVQKTINEIQNIPNQDVMPEL